VLLAEVVDRRVTTPVLMGRNGGLIETVRLPFTGTYSVLVDPQGIDAGSVTLQLYDVPPHVTGTITPGDARVSVRTTAPGQNATLTFTGIAGQRVSLRLSGVTIGSSTCCSAKVGRDACLTCVVMLVTQQRHDCHRGDPTSNEREKDPQERRLACRVGRGEKTDNSLKPVQEKRATGAGSCGHQNHSIVESSRVGRKLLAPKNKDNLSDDPPH
jgi:hypothetical protein